MFLNEPENNIYFLNNFTQALGYYLYNNLRMHEISCNPSKIICFAVSYIRYIGCTMLTNQLATYYSLHLAGLLNFIYFCI